jgi:C4-dicarboxylate-binding protein DctP
MKRKYKVVYKDDWLSCDLGRVRRFGLSVCGWLICAAATCLPVAANSAEPALIRFSHVTSETSPKGIGARRFKELVEQRLAGKLRVEIYPGASRYDDDRAILALLLDELEMAAPSLSKFRPVSRRLQVFDIPFLFQDLAHLRRFQEGPSGKELLESMQDRGLRGLAYWDNGPRVIATKRPLKLPGDLKGSVFRIEPSDVTATQYRQLDVVPIALPFSRVRDAAITGLVNGQENSWSNIASKRLHDYLPNLIELDHSYLSYMVVIRASFWNELPEDVRAELEKIVAEVTAEVNRLALEKNKAARAAIAASGVAKITEPRPDQKSAWKAALAPVREEFADVVGRELIEEAAKAAAQSN